MKGIKGIGPNETDLICSPDCERLDFRLNIAVGPLDTNTIKTYFRAQISNLQDQAASFQQNDTLYKQIQNFQNPE